MAATRKRRDNAGSRMVKLLDAEEEDEFYITTYGGFTEEAEDNDYASEGSGSDTVDSDFDIDENDELKSDAEDDGPRRQIGRVVTKAYKDPKKTSSSKVEEPKVKRGRPKRDPRSTVQIYHTEPFIVKKSLRRTTTEKSQAAVDREKERDARNKVLKEMAAKKNVSEVRRLTQEELLAEAEITEEINIQALETYRRMELEKKKARVTKKVYKGPIIRYQSVTMPLIEELPEAEINVDGDAEGEPQIKKQKLSASEKCSRTFITFTDEKVFKQYFLHNKQKPAIKQYCPVTRLPAKYFDPITQQPYANAQAFKLIREACTESTKKRSDEGSGTDKRRQRTNTAPEVMVKSLNSINFI